MASYLGSYKASWHFDSAQLCLNFPLNGDKIKTERMEQQDANAHKFLDPKLHSNFLSRIWIFFSQLLYSEFRFLPHEIVKKTSLRFYVVGLDNSGSLLEKGELSWDTGNVFMFKSVNMLKERKQFIE